MLPKDSIATVVPEVYMFIINDLWSIYSIRIRNSGF